MASLRWGMRSSLNAPLLQLAIATVLLARLTVAAAWGQQPAIYYVYDELNRLIAVVDQQGSAAAYTYDAVGNILRIDRFDSGGIPGAVGITLVSPGKGKIGAAVQIFGKGFSAVASQNSVAFNGTPATVTAAAPNRLVTSVPSGAATGPITVTAPLGSAASPMAFVVLGTLTVTPATASTMVRRTVQFQAFEAGSPTEDVRWAVNAITGGQTSTGTISDDGLYTAPAAVPNPATVTITATHKDDPTLSASATVTILPPALIVSPGVSVGPNPRPAQFDKNVGVSLSVVVGTAGTFATTAVSVDVSTPGTLPSVGMVSVQVEPVISAIAPSSAARGTSNLAITITGAGLTSATALTFLRNNSADGTITVANLAASADGTQATAEISIAAGAALGERIVRITTSGGISTAAGTGGNVFTVE